MVLPFVLSEPYIFPVMIILRPLMIIQYLYWHCHLGQERQGSAIGKRTLPFETEFQRANPVRRKPFSTVPAPSSNP